MDRSNETEHAKAGLIGGTSDLEIKECKKCENEGQKIADTKKSQQWNGNVCEWEDAGMISRLGGSVAREIVEASSTTDMRPMMRLFMQHKKWLCRVS